MRFKQWLLQSESSGGAATSIMHGGLQDNPYATLNMNLPVQSKIMTKDGSDKVPDDPFEMGDWKKPDKLFKLSPTDKLRSRERPSQWIDKSRRRARFVTVPPDTIY